MRRPVLPILIVVVAFVSAVSCGSGGASRATLPSSLRLPPGFRIAVFAEVPGARSMALGEKGTLFVGTRARAGDVFAVPDATRVPRAGRVVRIASGLDMPNGVAFRDGALYIAEVSRVTRLDGIESRLDEPPAPVVVKGDFPADRHHGWKVIAFGPDGNLYVPVGAPCNSCERLDDPRYASITRMRPDGSAAEVFASGVRNTVGFDWHPVTKELWFTDNGRDWMGDDMPPDELNRAPEPGLHFGYPYCHGGSLADDQFGGKRPCSDFTQPERNLGPHVAALGMKFYRGSMFPAEYRGQILIAEHGSWNRSTKIGYRVMLVRLVSGKAASYEPFLDGFLSAGKVRGRPVDVLELPDGSVLVSDDDAGRIYRITYEK